MNFYIYKTTNLINGKIYVGQRKSVFKEDPEYLGSGKILIRAIEKEGKENFKKELICECFSKKEANEKETFWIQELKAYDRDIGYNISKTWFGGDTISNNPNRENILKKIGNSLKGDKHFTKKMSEEELENWKTKGIKNGLFGTSDYEIWVKKYGKEEADRREAKRRKKMSLTLRGENNKLRGIPKSEEAKRKSSESHKNLEKINCKYCNKNFDPGNFKKYHGDNCKNKPGNENKKIIWGKLKECPYCHKSIDCGNYGQYHGERCKMKSGMKNINE